MKDVNVSLFSGLSNKGEERDESSEGSLESKYEVTSTFDKRETMEMKQLKFFEEDKVNVRIEKNENIDSLLTGIET
jgi:HD superfamily phosphodiesterase